MIGLTGLGLIFFSYVGFGLCTMCVILWRLMRGKTGYQTHFQNPLLEPLIKK